MTDIPHIGFLCASLRDGSINKRLSKALQHKAVAAGASIAEIDLGNYELPIYHGDMKTPEAVHRLIQDMKAFDGIIVITPEYNGSLPPLLKNAIDWTSTVETGHITGPVYGIAACTPGPMSGIMVMRQLQFILMRLGANLVPAQAGCGHAAAAFDDQGALIAEPASTLADRMLEQMLHRIRG